MAEAAITAAQMVTAIKAALLASPAAVLTIVVDGQTVTYARAQAIAELKFWQTEAAKEAGTRRRIATINLRNL